MAGTIKDLGKFQWGIESTSGALVPATSVVAVEDIVFTPKDTVGAPRIAQGLAIATPGQEYIPMRGTRFSIPDHPAFFEQLPDWFNMGLGLDAAPTGVGPYVWTHVRDITGNYAPQTRSVERRKTEGTSPLDHEWGYAFLESIRFSSTIDNAVQKSATGFARRVQASTLTAAQALPSGLQTLLGELSTVYIDDAWGSLGGTQITAKILGWSWEFTTGLTPFRAADGRTDLDFSGVWLDPTKVGATLEITAVMDSLFTAEKAKAEAAALRAIRIQVDGDDATRQLQLDGLYKYTGGSIFEVGEREGQDIVTLSLRQATDATNFAQAVVTNNIATAV